MRTRSILLAGLAILASAGATTLQELSLDEMIRQSTGIVRAKVTGAHSALHGQNIYTYYRLQILEAPKAGSGQGTGEIEVAVPGGTANGMRQVALGSPELTTGSEYVVFLWTGKSGLTQIMGLSQGLFAVAKDSSGNIRLTRPAAGELMVDQNGHPVSGGSTELGWSELRAQIRRQLNPKESGK